jgi:hypothetical protein
MGTPKYKARYALLGISIARWQVNNFLSFRSLIEQALGGSSLHFADELQ